MRVLVELHDPGLQARITDIVLSVEGCSVCSDGPAQMAICDDLDRTREFATRFGTAYVIGDHPKWTASSGVGRIPLSAQLEEDIRWVLRPRSSLSWATLIAQHPDGIVLVHQGNIGEVNARFEQLIGGGPLSGRSIWEVIHHEDRDRWDALENGTSDFEEIRLVRNDGVAVHTECSLITLGHRIAAAFRSREQERSLQQQIMLSDRLASVGTLAAGVAHELNNPLSYLLSGLQLAREEAKALDKDDEHAARFVKSMDTAIEGARRMAGIVRDLKTFSRGGDVKTSVIHVAPSLRSAVQLCEHEMRHRGDLKVTIASMPTVEMSASRLSQVFLNLLINASHAIEAVRDGRVYVNAGTNAHGWARIAISDNGGGIHPSDAIRIFDPFFTTKAGLEGTGLGLSISRRLVTDAGGELSVESAPGEGATFTVSLPPANRAVTHKPKSTVPPAPGPRTRVLIIDDERLIGHAMERALRVHDVQVTADGREAVKLLQRQDFDIVFCDVMMPHMSGIDVYEAVIATMPEYRHRFIFMTGGAFTTETQAFLAQTECPIIDKPFDLKEVRGRINEAEQQSDSPDQE